MTLTKEQVFEALCNNASAEIEGQGEGTKIVYYLHVQEDGVIVDCFQKADMSFTNWIPYWDYADTLEEFEDMKDLFDSAHESMNWGPFAYVVEDLTNQANYWLKKVEQEEEAWSR